MLKTFVPFHFGFLESSTVASEQGWAACCSQTRQSWAPPP